MSTVLTTETIAIKTETKTPSGDTIIDSVECHDGAKIIAAYNGIAGGGVNNNLVWQSWIEHRDSDGKLKWRVDGKEFLSDIQVVEITDTGVLSKDFGKQRAIEYASKLLGKYREPDPAPKAPLPTASIDKVDSPETFNRSDWRWNKHNSHSKPASYTSTRNFENLAKLTFKGETVAYQDSITGATWNVEFVKEIENDYIFIIMLVNGRIHSANTYVAYRDRLRLLNRWIETEDGWQDNYPSIVIYEGSHIPAANWLGTLFESYLLREVVTDTEQAVPATVAQVEVLPKPLSEQKELAFSVGDKVTYKNKTYQVRDVIQGRNGEPYIGIRRDTVLPGEKGKAPIFYRPKTELTAVAMKAKAA